MQKRIAVAAAAAAVLLGLPAVSSAIPVLDQSQELINNGLILSGDQSPLQQSFTVGISGLLGSIDLAASRRSEITSGTFTLSLLDSDFGTSLYSTVVSITSLPTSATEFTTFDLTSAGLFVLAGSQLAISISDPVGYNQPAGGGCNPMCWSAASATSTVPDPYAGGTAYVRSFALPSIDYAFRTYVDPAVTSVPEPSTLVLLGLGLLGLGATRRSRGSHS